MKRRVLNLILAVTLPVLALCFVGCDKFTEDAGQQISAGEKVDARSLDIPFYIRRR